MVCFRSTPAVINTRLKPYIFINKSKIDSVFIFFVQESALPFIPPTQEFSQKYPSSFRIHDNKLIIIKL